ncbi:hypothetical protein NQ176_g2675 [Zarea fungicola]|uniref:Uncharacterized protein n=1 Tax=Zarea fungicola TaxID=93591 RepID=A0ACC1NN63_9HYPO|nr:hypothetical protein NQ176_g2675 [Lecanicillium fungicola]
MLSFHKFMVLATLGLTAAAASDECTDDIVINAVDYNFGCTTVSGKVTVSPTLQGALNINGPKTFKSDFIVNGTTQLLSITSSTLKEIDGQFLVQDATLLSSINMPSLSSLSQLTLNRLAQLQTLQFSSSGVSDATSVNIADTFLSDISGLNLATVDSMTINNNKKLTMFNSNLVNITKTLILVENGNDMQVNLTELQSAYEIQISNVKSLDAPALTQVQSGLKFDTNPNLVSFQAANLTSVGTAKNGGSVSFINNAKLGNISFPLLKTIAGDLTVVNNTVLDEITGFPSLTTVYNMLLGGNFENATLPKLDDVKGTINVKSTSNITDVCKFFNSLKGKVVQGKVNCEGGLDSNSANNQNGLNSSSSSGSGNKKNAAGVPVLSTAAMFLGLVAAAAQLL